MTILQFLFANWDSVLVVVAAIIAAVVLIWRGQAAILKNILYYLVTEAEKKYGDGTGNLKFSAVADWLYEQIPAILKVFFSARDIERMIEEALAAAKQRWASNSNLQTYIQQGPTD